MKKKKINPHSFALRSKAWGWFAIPLVVVLTIVFLILLPPKNYSPLRIADENQISKYLTNQLVPAIYNNSQYDKPFDVIITEEGLNDIIARRRQPMNFKAITFSDPQAILTEKSIIIMARAKTRFASPILTIDVTPIINSSGLLILHVNNAALGKIGITKTAKSIGDNAFNDWLEFTGTEPNNIAAQICRSLINDEPFEPVFIFWDKSLQISKIKMEKKKIIATVTANRIKPASSSKTH